MVKILGGEILFRKRTGLPLSDIKSWPLVRRRQKFYLSCNNSNNARVLTALEEVQERKDCDRIYLQLVHLLDDKIWLVLERLFKTKDRSWDVFLHFLFPLSINRARLQNALSILQSVKYLHFRGNRDTTQQLAVLQSLPKFENLECLDIENWSFDQNALQDVLDCPFLPPYTIFCLTPRMPLTEPVFAKETVGSIHSISLSVLSSEEPEEALRLLQEVALLPVLNELDVSILDVNLELHAEPLSTLCSWLESPQCPLTKLSIHFAGVDQRTALLLLATIPKIPRLEALKLLCNHTHLYLDDFLQIITNAPSLSIFYLHSGVDLNDELTQKLLQFQLDCRPRMLSIQRDPETSDPLFDVSRIYQVIQNFEKSSEKGSFPMSAWPWFLELLGDSMYVQFRAVRTVGLDSIFQMLKQLLSSYTCNWEWKLVLSVHPVQFTGGKKRRQSWLL